MEKPVVATEAGGVPEIVKQGETGWLVEPGQPDRLAEAVGSLLADRAQAIQFGESGRRVAEDRFSLHRHAQRVQSLYHELMGVCCGVVAISVAGHNFPWLRITASRTSCAMYLPACFRDTGSIKGCDRRDLPGRLL